MSTVCQPLKISESYSTEIAIFVEMNLTYLKSVVNAKHFQSRNTTLAVECNQCWGGNKEWGSIITFFNQRAEFLRCIFVCQARFVRFK